MWPVWAGARVSRFEPVRLPPERVPDGAVSMTALKHFQACPRSGYLYLLHKGTAQSVEMARGSAFHEIAERATRAMLVEQEERMPGDLIKAIVQEVLAESPVPWSEHDYIRECSYRWAEQTTLDPSKVIGVEQLVELEVGGWRVRCKLDLIEQGADGSVRIDDYKTSRAAPPYEEIARKRPDGPAGGKMAAKQFQLVVYALAARYGHPVRVEPCAACGGGGVGDLRWGPGIEPELGNTEIPCGSCGGRGHVEIPEPFPLAAGALWFDLRLVFPGIKNQEGTMVTRDVSLTPLELGEYRGSLEATLANLDRALETDDWPAIQSDEACKECPASKLCPIPKELRDHAGEINSVDDLREASEVLERRKASDAALRKEIKSFMVGHDLREVRYGATRAWRFDYSESERIEHKDEMWAAIERAVEFGEPFDKGRFVRVVGSTKLVVVDLTPDELAESDEEAA